MIIVNGPIRHRLEINCGYGCFGPGWQANATIGRVLRLLLINVGGAVPGVQDMSVMGQPSKYTMCVGENEEASPWEPLHVERGLQPSQSAVTVVGISGCFNILGTREPALMVREIADALGYVGSNDYRFAGQPVCALNSNHAAFLAQGGYDKAQLKQALFELAKRPVRDFSSPRYFEHRKSELGEELPGDRLIPMTEQPEDVLVMVAGGQGAGAHNLCIPSFGNTRAVTVAIS